MVLTFQQLFRLIKPFRIGLEAKKCTQNVMVVCSFNMRFTWLWQAGKLMPMTGGHCENTNFPHPLQGMQLYFNLCMLCITNGQVVVTVCSYNQLLTL